MPISPLLKGADLVSFKIIINGKDLDDTYSLLFIDVKRAMGTIPSASFVLSLPDENQLGASESNKFVPGNKVEIQVGYDFNNESIFSGLIIRHSIKISQDGNSQLTLYCQDEAVKMTLGKKIRAYAQQRDSDIIQAIANEYGLKNRLDATDYVHPQLIQTGKADWDFLRSRAKANSALFFAEDGRVCFQKPNVSGTAELVLTNGVDVFEMEADLDAGYQLPGVRASGWDFAAGAFAKGQSTEPKMNAQGNLSGKKLAAVMGNQETNLRFSAPMEKAELNNLSNGLLLRSRLTALRGQVAFPGNASPALNTLIELAGFGDRFDGMALITSIRHVVKDGTWRTETGFGLPPEEAVDESTALTAGHGQLPALNGLQNGEVKQIDKDPGGEHRVLVSLPTLGASVWARQTNLYATKGVGSFFLPEVGDEVIVGFLNDDPRFAIILGSVYSSKNAPPYTADEENTIKALVTKSELKIEMNDKDKVLTISTPAGNTFTLSDKDKSITVEDQNSNKLTMDSRGITMKSAKDIIIDAGGKLTLKAKQNIDAVSAGGDVSLKGLNVTGNGQVGATLKGGATAELSARGQTTVKGAMVCTCTSAPLGINANSVGRAPR